MFFGTTSSQDISLNEDLCKVRSLRLCLGTSDRTASMPFFLKQKYLRVLYFRSVVQEVPGSTKINQQFKTFKVSRHLWVYDQSFT